MTVLASTAKVGSEVPRQVVLPAPAPRTSIRFVTTTGLSSYVPAATSITVDPPAGAASIAAAIEAKQPPVPPGFTHRSTAQAGDVVARVAKARVTAATSATLEGFGMTGPPLPTLCQPPRPC